MSINKLSHLTEWEKIYLEVTKQYPLEEGDFYYGKEERFDTKGSYINVSDNDTFYTLDDLKKLANDGMPKQGDEIEVRWKWCTIWNQYKFIAFYEWKIITEYTPWNPVAWDEWRLLQKKTELTLAEVEERLGLDAWSLIIK